MARNNRNRRSSMRDRVKKQAEENKYSGGGGFLKLPEGTTFIKVKKGTRMFDFLPFEVKNDMTVPDTASKDLELSAGELWYQRSILVHHGIGADQKSYLCPRTIKKPCPICEERARLMKEPDADEKLIQDLKPQLKDLFNVIDLDDDDKKICILEYSYANFRKKLEEEIREGEEDWAGFADLEQGYTIKVRFSEESFAGHKYFEASRIDFKDRKNYGEDMLDKVVDLNECLVVLPYEKLERIFLELGEEDGSSDDDPKPGDDPKPSRRNNRRQDPEPEPDNDPEPEPEPDNDPEPEPEPEPKKTDKKKSDGKKGGKCPYGGTFGKDCDMKDECFDCEKWEACRDASEAK